MRGDVPLNGRVFNSRLFDASRKQKTTFIIGQLVDVSKRTEVGMCEPGGVARITSVDVGRSGVESYDVSYVVDARKERRLSVDILKEHVTFEGRPRRSLEAETQGSDL